MNARRRRGGRAPKFRTPEGLAMDRMELAGAMWQKQLGETLRIHRVRRGLTQAQLAEFLEISLKYIGEIERGEANTSLKVIQRIAVALGWDMSTSMPGREPISEGVRRHLIKMLRSIRRMSLEMKRWLEALDPVLDAVAQSKTLLPNTSPQKRGRLGTREQPPDDRSDD